jgi:hypothetical protein
MPQALAAVEAGIEAVATAVSAFAANTAAYITGGNIAIDTAVSEIAYAAVPLTIYAGLSTLLLPKVPKPEQGLLTLKQDVPPRRRGFGRYRTGGPFALWAAREDFAFDIVMLHDGLIDGVEAFWLNDDQVTLAGDVVQEGPDGRYPPPQVKIFYRLGEATETAYEALLTGLPDIWTSAHRGDGIASLLLTCQNGKAVHQYHNFPNGEPSATALIRAQRVFDPRDVTQDEADPSTWKWSTNPVLCLLTYFMYERGYAYDWSALEVATFNQKKWNRRFGNTLAYWVAAADVCDEPVDLAGGGTEPRYQIGGQYTLDQDESSVVNTVLTSMDGWLGFNGRGGVIVYAGKFTPPAVTLTEAQIKSYTRKKGVPIEDRVNQVVIQFTDPAKAYNTNEADPWTDDAAVAKAGRVEPETLDLPWVQSFTQARRLAKRRMLRHQASYSGSMTVNFAARAILGERFIQVDLATGPASMQGLIIEVTSNLRINMSTLEISFDWVAVDPDLRDGWTPETDEGSTPSTGNGGGTQTPPADPVINTGSAFYGEADVSPRLTLNVTGPDRADLSWQIQWRVHGTTLWTVEAWDDGITTTRSQCCARASCRSPPSSTPTPAASRPRSATRPAAA